MNILKKILSHYIFDEKLSLNERNVNLVYLCGAITVLLTLFAHCFESSSLPLMLVICTIFLFTLALLYFRNRFTRFGAPMAVGLLALGDVLFPVVFFFNGGTSSGMVAYFVLILVALFLVLGGRVRIVLLGIFVIVVCASYYGDYRYGDYIRTLHKDLLRPLTGVSQFIDHVQSFVLAGLFIGCALKFQHSLYKKEQAKSRTARERRLRQNELLQVINNAAVRILTAGDERFSQAVNDSIATMAQCIDADRGYIWKRRDDGAGGACYSCLSEWTATEELRQRIGIIRGSDMPPGWEEKLLRGEHAGGDVAKMSPREQENLRENGSMAVLCVPVFLNGLFWGFLLFDDCHSSRDFLDDEVDILRSAALMLANAVERNAAQARMVETEERARILVDEAPVGIMMWTDNLDLIDCNEEAVRLFGAQSKEELIARFYDFAPETQPDGLDSRAKLLRVLGETLDTGEGAGNGVYEWAFTDKAGLPLPAEITLTGVKLGDSAMALVYFRDLRDLKRMLSEIATRDMLLRTVNDMAAVLLQSTSESFEKDFNGCCGMLMKAVRADRLRIWKRLGDGAGRVTYSLFYAWEEHMGGNNFFNEGDITQGDLFTGGYDRLLLGECLNGPVRSLPISPDNPLIQGVASILGVPIFLQDELWGMANFSDFYTERTFSPFEETILRSGTLFLANAIERNSLRTNLINAREEALANTKAKTAFLATMSHEIRTPLNAIIGLAEIQLQRPLSQAVRGDLEKILASGSTLLAIINDMLDISKIETGSLEIIPGTYDISSLINDTAQLNVVRIGSKPITFQMSVDSTLPAGLFGDELRVKQVLNNVLSNAFKYTRAGFVKFSSRWEQAGGDMVNLIFSVSDSGIGIREEDRVKLFAEYSQLDTRVNRAIEGTGLGLSITKNLVEMMGGSISVESEYGKGSTFTVRLLQRVVDFTPIGEKVARNLETFSYFIGKHSQATNILRSDLSHGSVLVVDDVQTNLDVTRGFLLPYGLTIDCVLSGQEAIEKIRRGERKYDIIFMDHMMPGMDGLEATKIIRSMDSEYARQVPIVALTANALAENEKMFLANGFDAFVPKPIDILRLDGVLNAFIKPRDKGAAR
ncbi:MAG: response regulator [Spirochaetaceae bacterium]|jgi:signal transduction histidine kinase/CheY-like chemotaxis protein|nr:response regulator [Spirochaetaceae bacterium]